MNPAEWRSETLTLVRPSSSFDSRPKRLTPSDGYSCGSISLFTSAVINRDMRKRAWERVTICALSSARAGTPSWRGEKVIS